MAGEPVLGALGFFLFFFSQAEAINQQPFPAAVQADPVAQTVFSSDLSPHVGADKSDDSLSKYYL